MLHFFKLKLFLGFFLSFATLVSAHPIELETERLVIRPWHPKQDTRAWGKIEREDLSPPFAQFFPWFATEAFERYLNCAVNRIQSNNERALNREESFAETFVTESVTTSQSTFQKVLKKEGKTNCVVPVLPAPYAFAIYTKESQYLIGYIAFSALDEKGFSEFSWALSPASRGKGYGSEALKRMIEHFSHFVGQEVPDFSGESQKWQRFNGLQASVNIYNVGCLRTLGKYMSPFKVEDNNLFGLHFMDICFQYPPQRNSLKPQDLHNIRSLSSRNQGDRAQAFINMIGNHGVRGGFYPLLSQELYRAFIVSLFQNDFAGEYGLPAP